MHFDSLWARISTCIASLLLVVSGCGGGAPGTGGTGITAASSYPIQSEGSISGFGSVIVNGVRFDDSNPATEIHSDGLKINSWQLGLGMQVSISGQTTSTTATLATATSIDAWSIAQGTVTSAASGNLSVAGMAISISPTTVYGGTATSSSIAPGDTIKVWGLPTNSQYTSWVATRIELTTASSVITTSGILHGVTGIVSLNGYSLTSTTAPLKDGLAATVSGNSATATALSVNKLHLLNAVPAITVGTRVEREGAITEIISATSFKIGSTLVDSSAAQFSPQGSMPTLGARAEAKGSWNGRVLVAQSVEVKTQTQLQEVELSGLISGFVSTADFVVRGLHCDASQLTVVGGGKLSDLKDGVRVHLDGSNLGTKIKVKELEIVTGP